MEITMKVRDFIKLNMDIDVYDNVTEELGIAYCGPMLLTDEGKAKFEVALNLDVTVKAEQGNYYAIVDCEDEFFRDNWKLKLKQAKKFFYAAAGYCDADDYDKWFIQPDFGQYAIDPDASMDITIYCDSTPWFTDDEIERDNLCEMCFPRKMVQEFYISRGGSINTFVQWIQDEYTADDTDGLWSFCKDRGFIAVREF